MRIKRVKNSIFIMQQDGIYEIKEKKKDNNLKIQN